MEYTYSWIGMEKTLCYEYNHSNIEQFKMRRRQSDSSFCNIIFFHFTRYNNCYDIIKYTFQSLLSFGNTCIFIFIHSVRCQRKKRRLTPARK